MKRLDFKAIALASLALAFLIAAPAFASFDEQKDASELLLAGGCGGHGGGCGGGGKSNGQTSYNYNGGSNTAPQGAINNSNTPNPTAPNSNSNANQNVNPTNVDDAMKRIPAKSGCGGVSLTGCPCGGNDKGQKNARQRLIA